MARNPGGPGRLPSRGSNRSGRAQFRHPAPRATGSLRDGRHAVVHPWVAIFRCFVKMGSRLDVRGICPSGSSVARPPPSLHEVPWGGFPSFLGTMQRLRRLGSPRAWASRARDPDHFCSGARRPLLQDGEHETSQVPGEPLRTCPALRPRRTARPWPRWAVRYCLPLRKQRRLREQFPFEAQSRGLHTPYVRFAAGVTPRTTQHSVPAGAYPLPGQDFHLLGSFRKFPSCRACYMASPSSRLRLAQFPRKLSFPWRCHPRLKRTAAARRRVFLTACVPPSARATKPPHGRTSAGSVRTAKGGHQRVTMLPGSVRAALGGHLRAVKTQHDADLRIGTGSVALPGALATKPSSISNWNSKAPQSWS